MCVFRDGYEWFNLETDLYIWENDDVYDDQQ